MSENPERPKRLSIADSIKETTEEISAVRKELADEKWWRRKAQARAWVERVVVAFLMLFLWFQIRDNGSSVHLLRECVIPPKVASAPGLENCYERGQINQKNAVKALVDQFDATLRQRNQEFLDAINSGKTTIVFTPTTTTVPPQTTTGTTFPKVSQTTGVPSTVKSTTSTTARSTTTVPPSLSTTTSSTSTTTTTPSCIQVDGVKTCKTNR